VHSSGLARVTIWQHQSKPPRIWTPRVPQSPDIDTPRGAIRHATRDIHERLHDLEAFRALLTQTITPNEYCTLLESLYGFHQPLEAALVAHAATQPSLPLAVPRRAHLLREDLAALHPGGPPANLPCDAPPLDLLTRPGGYLGCLYVREGATLGGRVLAGKLDHLLGTRAEGRRFFAGTPHDAEAWRACCAAIDRHAHGAALGGMIAAARATFECFERWMTRADKTLGGTV
jgi:heme oxygenase